MSFRDLSPEQTLLDTHDERGRGITTSNRLSLRLALNGGHRKSARESDAGSHLGTLRVSARQHVAVTGGGLNDGGAVRDYGCGCFDAALAGVNGRTAVMLTPKLSGQLKQLRIYLRHLRTSAVVGNWRAGAPERRP